MFSKWYKNYVLLIMTLVYTLNYLDRVLIIILLQPIKEDLHLSDTQLGFLTGIPFGLFYATLGIPIARWADRGNRSTITAVAIGLWGGTVMSCLFVTNYSQLVFARIAAAVGESGCMPPTYSLLGDYFTSSSERTRAMTVYWLASPLSSLISFVVGGRLNQACGWRMTFFLMGIPALLVAGVVKMTIREPRILSRLPKDPKPQVPRMADVLSMLWHQRSCRHLGLAIILLWTMGLGLAPWYAAFMVRSHGMQTAELGLWLGLIFGIGGIAGVLSGGYVVRRWLAEDEQGQMRLSAMMIALLVPFLVLFLLLPHKYQAFVALTPYIAIFSFIFGPTFALLQRLVANDMRATALAVVMLLSNLIGMGIGPQIVGILSDLLFPSLGRDSLRYAMLVTSSLALLAAYHFWKVGVTVKADLYAIASTDCRVSTHSTLVGVP